MSFHSVANTKKRLHAQTMNIEAYPEPIKRIHIEESKAPLLPGSRLQLLFTDTRALWPLLFSFFVLDYISAAKMRSVCKYHNPFHHIYNEWPDKRLTIQYHYLTNLVTIHIRSYIQVYQSSVHPRIIPIRPDLQPYNNPKTRFNFETRPDLFVTGDVSLSDIPCLRTVETIQQMSLGCDSVEEETSFTIPITGLADYTNPTTGLYIPNPIRQKAHSIIVTFTQPSKSIPIDDIIQMTVPTTTRYTNLHRDKEGIDHPVIYETECQFTTYATKQYLDTEMKVVDKKEPETLTDTFAALFINQVLGYSLKCNMLFLDEPPLGEKWRTTNLPRNDLFLSLQLGEPSEYPFTLTHFERFQLTRDSEWAWYILSSYHNPYESDSDYDYNDNFFPLNPSSINTNRIRRGL